MRALLSSLLEWYLGALDEGGYLLVALLMAMESSVIPLPSEFVIPPAAYLAYAHGRMSVAGAVVAGTLGSWAGASVMYWGSRLLGRPLLMRYGGYLLITPEKIEKAEAWSAHYGTMGVFVSRLLPVTRRLIGVPAGIVRIDFRWYSLVALAGSALWCTVLAWVGVTAGQDPELMAGSVQRISLWVGGLGAFLGLLYWAFVHRQMRR
jgi:membrane protein DedA with SNARE-associated domain